MTSRTLALVALLSTIAWTTARPADATVCNDPGQFGNPTSYTTGPNPLYTATGDFNHDGKPDIAVTNSEFPTIAPVGTVAILLNNGDLTFTLAGTYPVGSVPHGVVTGDFNGDGILDLAVANKYSNSISVLIGQGSGGNGNGTFAPQVSYPTTYRPFQLVAADFNEDGILDLAMSMNSSARMGVMIGQGTGGVGNGTFSSPTMYILNAASTGIATADFNSDGILDLVATENTAGTIEVRLGNGSGGVGTGSFGPASHFAAGIEPVDFAVDDFNGDGIPDLAVANTTSGGTGILLGVGNGAFQSPIFLPSGNTASVASLDANGDGIKDLVTTSATGSDTGDLQLFLGSGSGGVGNGTFDPGTAYNTNLDEYQVIAVDLDADGKPELISSAYLHDYIQVFPGACIAAPPDERRPLLTDVRDVPHDQGGKVFLTWTASSLDAPGGPILNYRVWRRVPAAFAVRVAGSDDAALAWRTTSVTRTDGTTAVEYWEPIVTLPAQRRAGYGYTSSTLSDSADAWVPYESYFVSALTSNIDVFYDSNVDSGYSVDNLPPAAPAGITGTAAAAGVLLQWQPNQEADVAGYRVYRGTDPGFATGTSCLLASPGDPAYTDASEGWFFYKVTAVDKHGNESAVAEVTSPITTGVTPGVDLVFSLRGATPNPASGDDLRIAFSLPSTEAASVTVMDVAGRTVATRQLASPAAGAQTLLLSGTQRLPAGMYLVHLKQGRRSAVQRVVVSR